MPKDGDHSRQCSWCLSTAEHCRLQVAQTQAADATDQVCAIAEQLESLADAQRDRAARNDLIQRTMVPLQQEVDKISMLLLGVQDIAQHP